MSGYKPFIILLILLAALIVACGPLDTEPGGVESVATATPQPVEDTAGETPEPNSAAGATTAAAIAFLANELGLTEAEIELLSAEATEFTDSCLGLGQPNESCLQAITPGWLIMLSAAGEEYEVRTDETGEQVRIAGEEAGMNNAPDAAAVAHLANVLGVAEADIEVVSVEATEFSDSCLGLGQPDESCLQAITPGWLVILSVDGQQYEVHTDETAQHVRVK